MNFINTPKQTHAHNYLRTHMPNTTIYHQLDRQRSHRRCDGISRYQRVKQLTASFYRLLINTSNIFGIFQL